MAAPTLTPRQTPTGFKMPEGFRSLVTFQNKPAVQLWEKSVKPGGLDGGNPIKTSTQHNSKVHTQEPPTLIMYDSYTMVCAFNPNCIPDVRGLVNVNQSITHKWPDGATTVFYGWLQKVEWGDLKEAEQPEATVTIAVSNWDPVNRVEVEAVYTPAAGTA